VLNGVVYCSVFNFGLKLAMVREMLFIVQSRAREDMT
jgi:hypothetical protein